MSEWTPIGDIIKGKHDDEEVWIRGWIYRKRESGKILFIVVRDSTDIIQCIVSEDSVTNVEFADAKKALVESSLKVRGVVRKDARAPGGYELSVTKINIVNFSDVFPIKEGASEEFLLDNRHLWIRSRKMCNILKIRVTVFEAIREYFKNNNFIETHSPMFVGGAAESTTTVFEVPYFGRTVYLAQTWQLHAEAVIYALEKIYTIAPSFRAEKSRTRRHLTEYWHAEVEAAWYDYKDMMKIGEELVEHIVQKVIDVNRKELEFLSRDISKLEIVKAPFDKIRYDEIINMLQDKGVDITWGDDLTYSEEKLISLEWDKPVYVTHYPKRVKAFYHKVDITNPNVVLCFDLLAPEAYAEIIGGGEREDNYERLLARIKEENMTVDTYKWYLDLRRYGSVPHSGFGLGVDRTIAWLTGSSHIRDVIPFPSDPRRTY